MNKYFNKENLIQYGNFFKIKLDNNNTSNKKGKLILVTSMNPTPSGEGKTTTLIGINDCLNYFNKSSVACLRQPSMGPFFGIKGGATGSGECEIKNPQEINCGFTGDFYEIEAANNLIYSIIENEIYFNSSLNIDENKIFWKRCIDMNDRSLRDIEYYIKKDTKIKTNFTITAASNLMALFCLAKDKKDFKEKLENTIIALNKENKPVYIKDLKIIDALMLILDKALMPNFTYSKHNSPVIIHGGPFANIAHGCNSVIATNLGLNNFDYVLTEAGFGADLGAEKFLNIKCREANLVPNLVVLAITLKAVKYHGQNEEVEINKISKGFENVLKHIQTIKNFNLNLCIVINKFENDNIEELNYLKELCEKQAQTAISQMWNDGPKTSENIFNLIMNNIKENKALNYTYDLNDDVYKKIEMICKNIYGASKINFKDEFKKKIEDNKELIKNYYICNAKNQYSLSSNPNLLGWPKNFEMDVYDVEFNHASKFIIPIMSKIFLMPGLPKEPNARVIKHEQ